MGALLRLGNANNLPMRTRGLQHWWLLALSVGPQLAFGTQLPPALLVACMAGLLAFLILNRHRRGLLVAAVGVLLNLIVISANSGMPVSPSAIQAIAPHRTVSAADDRHVVASDETHLLWLGDTIPLRYAVVSPGDILLALGLCLYVFDRVASTAPSARPRRKRRSP